MRIDSMSVMTIFMYSELSTAGITTGGATGPPDSAAGADPVDVRLTPRGGMMIEMWECDLVNAEQLECGRHLHLEI